MIRMAADPDADWVDTLADDDALLTGEAVALDLRPASFALRAGGAVIDVAISILAFVVLIMAFFIPAGQLQLEAAWGTVFLISSLGMALGPALGGWIFDHFGTYGWLYVGSFAVGIGATAIALFFPPFPSRQRAVAQAA